MFSSQAEGSFQACPPAAAPVLHRLQHEYSLHHDIHHGLHGEYVCSYAWSTSFLSFFTDVGICVVMSHFASLFSDKHCLALSQKSYALIHRSQPCPVLYWLEARLCLTLFRPRPLLTGTDPAASAASTLLHKLQTFHLSLLQNIYPKLLLKANDTNKHCGPVVGLQAGKTASGVQDNGISINNGGPT